MNTKGNDYHGEVQVREAARGVLLVCATTVSQLSAPSATQQSQRPGGNDTTTTLFCLAFASCQCNMLIWHGTVVYRPMAVPYASDAGKQVVRKFTKSQTFPFWQGQGLGRRKTPTRKGRKCCRPFLLAHTQTLDTVSVDAPFRVSLRATIVFSCCLSGVPVLAPKGNPGEKPHPGK